MKSAGSLVICLVICAAVTSVDGEHKNVVCSISGHSVPGHGSMVEPPSRGVMHFYGFPNNPPNYNWMEGFCGGKSHQWGVNGGK